MWIIESSQKAAYQAVNTTLVRRNWLLGYRIASEEMQGEDRARYGAEIIKKLAKELSAEYGKGYTKTNLYSFYSFYKTYPEIFHSPSGRSDKLLSWTHYRVLLQVKDPKARAWYEKEAIEQTWGVRTLQRNISSQYYYRMLQTQKAIFFSSKKKRMTARLNCTERYLTSVPAGGVQNDIFHGFDMDRTMLRIGAMNMMTHGVENPFIEYRDSFSDQNSDREKYTLILANPPFKGSLDYDTVSADLLKICKTKKTELFKRAEVQDNDIPGILQRFKSREQEKERKRTEQSFMVDKKEIVENEYDLSINKYKEIEYVPVEYPPTEEIMADIYQPEREIKKNLDELSEMLKKNNKFVSAIQNSLEKTQQLFNNLMQKYFG